MTAPRSFLVYLAPDVRAIVTVAVEFDVSLPSPGEREDWVATAPMKSQIREAIAALHCARDLAAHDIAWRRPRPEEVPV